MYIYICLYSKLNSPLESHDWGNDLVTSGLSRSVGFGRPVVEPLAYETSPAFGYFTIRRRRMMRRRLPCTPCIYHPLYRSISFPLQTRSHASSFKLSLKHSIWVFFPSPPPSIFFLWLRSANIIAASESSLLVVSSSILVACSCTFVILCQFFSHVLPQGVKSRSMKWICGEGQCLKG